MQAEAATDLLAGPEYFFCEKLKCTLRKEICLRRQNGGSGTWGSREGYKSFEECIDCEQGKRIMEEQAELSVMRTCSECGKQFKPYKIGKHIAKSFCRDCYLKKRSEGQKRWRAGMPLRITFDGRKDLLEYLEARAREHFRAPEMEILAILDELKNKEVKDGIQGV